LLWSSEVVDGSAEPSWFCGDWLGLCEASTVKTAAAKYALYVVCL